MHERNKIGLLTAACPQLVVCLAYRCQNSNFSANAFPLGASKVSIYLKLQACIILCGNHRGYNMNRGDSKQIFYGCMLSDGTESPVAYYQPVLSCLNSEPSLPE